jgi:predicted nucleic acid-binding protein
MTALILDAGAFIAIERNDRSTVALLKAAQKNSLSLRSNGGVVAEVWRGGSGNQVPLSRLLAAVELLPVDDDLGRSAGALIRDAGGGSAIDATVVTIAREGDQIVTSDQSDIQALVNSSGRGITIISC